MMAQGVNIEQAKKDSVNAQETPFIPSQSMVQTGLNQNTAAKSPVDIIMDDTLAQFQKS